MVFLVKGPIYLVCISCTEEPYESLRGQLELLYGQVKLLPYLLVCLNVRHMLGLAIFVGENHIFQLYSVPYYLLYITILSL